MKVTLRTAGDRVSPTEFTACCGGSRMAFAFWLLTFAGDEPGVRQIEQPLPLPGGQRAYHTVRFCPFCGTPVEYKTEDNA